MRPAIPRSEVVDIAALAHRTDVDQSGFILRPLRPRFNQFPTHFCANCSQNKRWVQYIHSTPVRSAAVLFTATKRMAALSGSLPVRDWRTRNFSDVAPLLPPLGQALD